VVIVVDDGPLFHCIHNGEHVLIIEQRVILTVPISYLLTHIIHLVIELQRDVGLCVSLRIRLRVRLRIVRLFVC
jgi:hypothetical protein